MERGMEVGQAAKERSSPDLGAKLHAAGSLIGVSFGSYSFDGIDDASPLALDSTSSCPEPAGSVSQ